MAPEQLDPPPAIDGRADVYALGVVLYELLCGARPYDGADEAALRAAIRAGRPRLPVEVEPAVPEPLQAIALKAMSAEPARPLPVRARDGARPPPLRSPASRCWRARACTRPRWSGACRRTWSRSRSGSGCTSSTRTRATACAPPTAAWKPATTTGSSRAASLSFPQIALYFGAFLLLCASVLAFLVYLEGAVKGVAWPLLALGLPCVALHLAALRLHRGRHRAAAVAYDLGAAVLVPPLLLILFRETGLVAGGAG